MRLIVLSIHAIIDISQVQNRGKDLPNLIDFLLGEAAVAHAGQCRLEVLPVIDTFNSICISRRAKEAIVCRICRSKLELVTELVVCQSLIEDMEGALVVADGDGSRFLQEIGQDLGGLDLTSLCLHIHLDELAETR